MSFSFPYQKKNANEQHETFTDSLSSWRFKFSDSSNFLTKNKGIVPWKCGNVSYQELSQKVRRGKEEEVMVTKLKLL